MFLKVFYRAAWNGDENSVCRSVCPSVKRVDCNKTKEKTVQLFIPCERLFSLLFWKEEWLVGATPSTCNFGSTGPGWSGIADFKPIIDPAPQPYILAKSSINTNGKSFQRAKDDHHTLPLSPPKRAQKRKTADLRPKSHFAWRESATRFLCVKTLNDKVVRHSLA